jgi:hypothetical protein
MTAPLTLLFSSKIGIILVKDLLPKDLVEFILLIKSLLSSIIFLSSVPYNIFPSMSNTWNVLSYSYKGWEPKNFKRFIVQANSCLNHNAYDELDKIKCNTLVIGRDSDKVVEKKQVRKWLKE